jgi:hypothetical protein
LNVIYSAHEPEQDFSYLVLLDCLKNARNARWSNNNLAMKESPMLPRLYQKFFLPEPAFGLARGWHLITRLQNDWENVLIEVHADFYRKIDVCDFLDFMESA